MKVRYVTLNKWSNIYQRKQTKIKYKKKAQGHKLDKQDVDTKVKFLEKKHTSVSRQVNMFKMQWDKILLTVEVRVQFYFTDHVCHLLWQAHVELYTNMYWRLKRYFRIDVRKFCSVHLMITEANNIEPTADISGQNIKRN